MTEAIYDFDLTDAALSRWHVYYQFAIKQRKATR